MSPRRSALVLLATCAVAVAVAGCGQRGETVSLPMRTAPPGTAIPYSGTTTGPVTSSSPAATPPGPATSAVALSARLLGPGPQRAERDAQEVTALALRVEATAAVELGGLTLRAAGSLDDAAGVATARLAVDRDGDGRFDRAVDRVLASAGFAHDDGPLAFTFLPVGAGPGAPLDLLVVLDLSGRGHAQQEQRLTLEALDATSATGAAVRASLPAATGPWLRLGAWVTPHEALSVQGEALRPRALRDAQGRTHVGLFQNLNMTSNVWYSLHDGRSFSPPDNVSRAARTAWNHDLGLDPAGLPHLAWEEVDGTSNDYAIRHSRFDPAAFAWTSAEVLSAGHLGMQLNPRLLVSAGPVVDVVWEDWGPTAVAPRIAHRRHTAAGWTQVAEVTSASSSTALQARDPALAPLPGGELLVAWVENEPGRAEVRARRLTAGGAWGPLEVAAQGQGVLSRVELLDEGGVTHLLYVDQGEVLHARRTAQGWSRPANVSRSAAPSSDPAMGLWQGALQVVWFESLNGGAHLAYARQQGGGFSAPELLTIGQGDVSRLCPAVVPEGDRLRLLWQDRGLGRQRIFSTWREATPLEAPRRVAATGGDPGRPALAEGARGALHAAWAIDAGGNGEVFHAVEPSPGAGFGAPENVSRSPGGSYQPTLAAAGDALHLAWEEETSGTFSVVVATRGPAGWSTPAAVSSGARAYAPRLAALPDGRAALAWTEETAPGDFDVRLSLHDGRGFAAALDVAPRAGSSAWSPALALSPAGAVAVAWEEEAARRDVLVAVVTPGGTSVAAVASSSSGQYAPSVGWSGDDLWAAWVEDGRLRAAVRRAGQARFDAPLELTTGGAWAPDLAASGGEVALAWEQWTGADARLLMATLTSAGAGAPVALDEAPGPARRAALTTGPWGGLHAAWSVPGAVWTRARRAR